MTRQILFVQGGGAGTHDEWDSKLVENLQAALDSSYEIRYPRMPNEAEPQYDTWKTALAHEFATLRDGAILVGHSIGGTVLIHALAELEAAKSFGAVILLAAPFVGEGGWESDEMPVRPNFNTALSSDVPLLLFHGLADETVPPFHADLYARAIPWAQMRRLPGGDHQFNNDLSEIAAVIRTI